MFSKYFLHGAALAMTVAAAPVTTTTKPSAPSASTSSTWAGGVAFSQGKMMETSVDIIVPECSLGHPAIQTVPYSVSGWAGIDGWSNCNDVVLQSGFYCAVQEINNVTNVNYYAWTEWYPSPQVTYNDFHLRAGDKLSIKIVAESKTSGSTSLYNHRTGHKASTHYKNQSTPLCLDSAEWVIESELAYSKELGGYTGERTAGYTPFKFENAVYTTKGGKGVNKAQKKDLFNMKQGPNKTEVAEAVFDRAGCFEVKDVTPADFGNF